ncbi:MAG: hypothetical protein DRJ11_09525, partial [Candidatus Aminicenantes bacterium]
IWHLEREFKQVLGEENQELVESLKELALRGKGQEILKRLMKESEDPEKEEKIAKLANYVVNNMEWIENIAEVAGYGSGPVEKTVDIVVARRFKKRGMSWLRQYPNPLLKIKLGSKLYIGETQAFLINYSGNLFLNYLSHFFLPLSALCKIFSIDYGISSPFILPFFTISSANFSAFSLVIVINLRPIKISLLK